MQITGRVAILLLVMVAAGVAALQIARASGVPESLVHLVAMLASWLAAHPTARYLFPRHVTWSFVQSLPFVALGALVYVLLGRLI